jgi:hypothetical protein
MKFEETLFYNDNIFHHKKSWRKKLKYQKLLNSNSNSIKMKLFKLDF